MTDTNILEPALDARSHAARIGVAMPASDVPAASDARGTAARDLRLPELSQLDVVRHCTRPRSSTGRSMRTCIRSAPAP